MWAALADFLRPSTVWPCIYCLVNRFWKAHLENLYIYIYIYKVMYISFYHSREDVLLPKLHHTPTSLTHPSQSKSTTLGKTCLLPTLHHTSPSLTLPSQSKSTTLGKTCLLPTLPRKVYPTMKDQSWYFVTQSHKTSPHLPSRVNIYRIGIFWVARMLKADPRWNSMSAYKFLYSYRNG